MATEFPESEEPVAPDAPDAPGLLGADPGAVPLLPPTDAQLLPGGLEGVPDSSARPAHTEGTSIHPDDLGGFGGVAADGPGNEFSPPAPGLVDGGLDAMAQQPPASAPAGDPAAAGSPAWASSEPPAASTEGTDTAERAAWPTVAADGSAQPQPPPHPQQPAHQEPAPVPAVEAQIPETDETIMRPPEDATSGPDMYDVPLGTLVYRSGLLSADQIESALGESERIGKRLGEVLIDSKMIDERDLGRLLAGQKGLPFLDLGQMEIEADATALLPAASARIYCALPIAVEKGTPVVAVSDPTNGLVVEGVRRAMGGELSFAVATRSDLQRAIAANYGEDGEPPEAVADTAAAGSVDAPAPEAPQTPELPPLAHEAPDAAAPEAPALQSQAPEEHTATPYVESQNAPPAAPDTGISSPQTPAEDPMTSLQPEISPSAPLISQDAPSQAPLAPATPLDPTPAETPAPLADAAPPQAVEKTVRVMIRLTDGDQIDAGAFASTEQAIERARALIGSIDSGSGSDWPFLSGRFLRPDTIVSIDLVEERPRF